MRAGDTNLCLDRVLVGTEILDNRPEPPSREVRGQMLMPEDVAAACVFAVNPAAARIRPRADDPVYEVAVDREDDMSQRSTT